MLNKSPKILLKGALLSCLALSAFAGTKGLPEPTVPGRYPTVNSMGWAAVPTDSYSQDYIQESSQQKGAALEVGAAYGLASLQLIEACEENGKSKTIMVNDLDARHLDVLKDNVGELRHVNLSLKPGSFLEGLDVEEGAVSSILASRVLHMLNGEEIRKALGLFHSWLSEGGKVYVIIGTPYNKAWERFIPEYEARKKRGDEFPGYIDNPGKWAPARVGNLPKYVHLLDIDVLSKLATEAGFSVEKADYIFREDTQDNLYTDKFESAGLVLVKQ